MAATPLPGKCSLPSVLYRIIYKLCCLFKSNALTIFRCGYCLLSVSTTKSSETTTKIIMIKHYINSLNMGLIFALLNYRCVYNISCSFVTLQSLLFLQCSKTIWRYYALSTPPPTLFSLYLFPSSSISPPPSHFFIYLASPSLSHLSLLLFPLYRSFSLLAFSPSLQSKKIRDRLSNIHL